VLQPRLENPQPRVRVRCARKRSGMRQDGWLESGVLDKLEKRRQARRIVALLGVKCELNAVLVTAYCGSSRKPATFLDENSASCGLTPTASDGPLVVVCLEPPGHYCPPEARSAVECPIDLRTIAKPSGRLLPVLPCPRPPVALGCMRVWGVYAKCVSWGSWRLPPRWLAVRRPLRMLRRRRTKNEQFPQFDRAVRMDDWGGKSP
jgi:hypothetical protein